MLLCLYNRISQAKLLETDEADEVFNVAENKTNSMTDIFFPKNHKKKKWQLNRLILRLPPEFPCLLKLLSQRSSILCLAEVPCLQKCVDFHYW